MNLLPKWWRSHFLRAEFVFAVLAASAFVFWAECLGGAMALEQTLTGNRSAIYGTLASIFGSLLGFVITAVSIVLGYSASDRLAIVRESEHYPLMWSTFTAAIRSLGAATALTLLGLALDRETAPRRWVLHLCVFGSALAVLRLARCVWILENVVRLVTAPSKARSGSDS